MTAAAPTNSGKYMLLICRNEFSTDAPSPPGFAMNRRNSSLITAYFDITVTWLKMSFKREARLNKPNSDAPRYRPSRNRGTWPEAHFMVRESTSGPIKAFKSFKCRDETASCSLKGTAHHKMTTLA